MRWWQWAQIAALGAAPFVAAEYQRRAWLRSEQLRQLLSLSYTLAPMAKAVAEAFRAMAVTMAEAAEALGRLGQAMRDAVDDVRYPQLWAFPIVAPVGEMEIVHVSLDECWRCSRAVPREDPLGLCPECRVQLRNL